ncbi:ComEC/Rec2 family competence protein [Campylobacterota bacterium DY0563]
MNITMFDAGKGDCILIQSGNTNILIDGGTMASYDNWFPILEKVTKLDGIFITHIDDDHTNGIIKFLEKNKKSETPIKIDKIFFNGFEQLLDVIEDEETEPDYKYDSLISKYSEVQSGEVGFSEGSSVSYLLRNEYNESFINEVISNEEGKNKYQIGELNIEFFSPSKEVLSELKSSWEEILNQKKIKRKILTKKHAKAFEKYLNTLNKIKVQSQEISSSECTLIDEFAESVYEADTSLANKSSLSFLVSNDSKKVLMLGDSHIETVNEYMNNNGLNNLELDAVKVSHHGSKGNINKEFIENIICNNYLISTNGHHNHPDFETLSRIAKFSKKEKTKIYINNSISKITAEVIKTFKEYEKDTEIIMNKSEIKI